MAIRNTIGRWLGVGNPPGGLEERAANGQGFTDLALDAMTAVAFSDALYGHTQAMLDASRRCARAVSRGKLEVDGTMKEWVEGALKPSVVADIIEDVVKDGNYVAEIDLDRGLVRPAKHEVQGASEDPAKWRYVLEFNTPTGKTRRRTLQAAAVVHVMVNQDPEKPWCGRSFFEQLKGARYLEDRMKELAQLPVQRFITVPGVLSSNPDGKRRSRGAYSEDPNEEKVSIDMPKPQLKQGGIIRVRNTGSRGGPEPIPEKTLGPAPTQYAVELRRQFIDETYEAVGYPPALRAESAPGQNVQAAYAAWVDAFLTPLADDVAMQLSGALDASLRFDLSQVRLSSRVEDARIFKLLAGAQGGLQSAAALKLAGLSTEGGTGE